MKQPLATQQKAILQQAASLLILSLPIIGMRILEASMPFINTAMLEHLSNEAAV